MYRNWSSYCLLYGLEELALDARVCLLRAGVNLAQSFGTGPVALRQLVFDELVVDAFGDLIGDRCLCFPAGAKREAAPTIGEVNQEPGSLGLEAGLVHFVRGAFAEVQGDAFHEVSVLS